MEKTDWLKKRIPTIIGLLILFLGAGVGIFLVGRDTGFLPRAGPELVPKQLKITNVSHDSFAVSWITDEPGVGFLRYGLTNDVDTTIVDDRDQLIGAENEYVTHHITVRGLDPGKKYFFKVGSGGANQLYDNNGQPYEVETAMTITEVPAAETIYGTALTPAATPAEGAIVYVAVEGAQALSSLVKKDGGFVIPLSTARTRDLSSYLSYDSETTIINILVNAGREQTATATTTTGNAKPVPVITLGQTLDFTQTETTTSQAEATQSGEIQETEETAEETAGGFGTTGNEATQAGELELLNPTKEGEVLNTQQPAIQGKAPAGVKIRIMVESAVTYTDNVVVDDDGTWEWSPPEDLEPGEHTVTVSYTDENGILQTLKRSFVVLAAGEEEGPAITATPSATPTPTPRPTPTPTSEGRTSQPATSAGVPSSGVLTPTLGLSIMGLVLILAGTALAKGWRLLE